MDRLSGGFRQYLAHLHGRSGDRAGSASQVLQGKHVHRTGEYYPAVSDRTDYAQVPSPEYGQFRMREDGKSPVGNVRKCTFCVHLQDEYGNMTNRKGARRPAPRRAPATPSSSVIFRTAKAKCRGCCGSASQSASRKNWEPSRTYITCSDRCESWPQYQPLRAFPPPGPEKRFCWSWPL